MNKEKNLNHYKNNDEVSLKEVIINIRGWVAFLISKWKIITVCLVVGVSIGILYAVLATPKYVASSTFALDERIQTSPGGGGGLAMLGLGGAVSGAGMFGQTQNIMWLYSTKSMLQKTLLTSVNYTDTAGKGQERLLIDWFIEESELDKDYIEDRPHLHGVTFSKEIKEEELSRAHHAIINKCISVIKSDYLTVEETKDAVDMISVNFISSDEQLSKLFTEELVNTVNNYYVETKTIKEAKEVEMLQYRADSFQRRMNLSIYDVAQSYDASPYANPNQSTLRVAPQQKQVDVQVNSAIFTELMKSLEISKQKLAQATPLINVIETPTYPLPVKKPSMVVFPVLFGFIFTFLAVAYLVGKEFLNRIMEED